MIESTLYLRASEMILMSFLSLTIFTIHGKPRHSRMSSVFAPNVLLIAMSPLPVEGRIYWSEITAIDRISLINKFFFFSIDDSILGKAHLVSRVSRSRRAPAYCHRRLGTWYPSRNPGSRWCRRVRSSSTTSGRTISRSILRTWQTLSDTSFSIVCTCCPVR